MKMKNLFAVASFSVLLGVLASCSKEENPPAGPNPDDETQVQELTNKKVSSDQLYDDVSFEVIRVNTENGLTAQPATMDQNSCATVTLTPKDLNTWPKTVTVDYGNTGCAGNGGFTRKGKIIYTLSQKLINTGAVLTVSFDNYYVNNHKLEGTYTITNQGSLTGLNVNVKLANGKITYPDGKWYTKTSDKTWVQAAGGLTLAWEDDEFNLTGTSKIASSTGNTLNAATKSKLLRKASCPNFVSGQVDLDYNSIKGVLDFGDGTCDKKAILKIGAREFVVDLP